MKFMNLTKQTHIQKKTKTNKQVLGYKVTGTLYFIDPFMIVNCTGYKKFVTFFNVVGQRGALFHFTKECISSCKQFYQLSL